MIVLHLVAQLLKDRLHLNVLNTSSPEPDGTLSSKEVLGFTISNVTTLLPSNGCYNPQAA